MRDESGEWRVESGDKAFFTVCAAMCFACDLTRNARAEAATSRGSLCELF